MRIEYLELSGFRGYRDKIRIVFGSAFTIIDGRNGVGKSTICDAVEFALTGTIQKYGGAKSDGESVSDYIWWIGDGDGPEHRYVEVGFVDGNESFKVRRNSIRPDTAEHLDGLEGRLCDESAKPSEALMQLCQSAIIRDELIAALSLDLKETERYARISSAIGVVGSAELIRRAQNVHALAKEARKSIEKQTEQAAEARKMAVSYVDQARASMAGEEEVGRARSALTELLGESDSSRIVERASLRLEQISEEQQQLAFARENIAIANDERTRLEGLRSDINRMQKQSSDIEREIEQISGRLESGPSSSDIQERAKRIALLAELGREFGLVNCSCPLCSSTVDQQDYEKRLDELGTVARNLDVDASKIAEQAAREVRLRIELEELSAALNRSSQSAEKIQANVSSIEAELRGNGFDEEVSIDEIEEILSSLRTYEQTIHELLRVVDTSRVKQVLANAEAQLFQVSEALKGYEVRLARANRAEQTSKTLLDSVRRAAGDALDLRISRILPLMSEMYSRLRPHPKFTDIEYKIRGDLRKHLSFRVGSDANINPQFVFSSGQRRAAGLAFLLSVNMSMAWSRWKTILLDDPVQHIDDFRSVHLAELLGQLVSSGRQVICAVEDSALADLLCRKMPACGENAGKRISLGYGESGSIRTLQDSYVHSFDHRIFAPQDDSLSA